MFILKVKKKESDEYDEQGLSILSFEDKNSGNVNFLSIFNPPLKVNGFKNWDTD